MRHSGSNVDILNFRCYLTANTELGIHKNLVFIFKNRKKRIDKGWSEYLISFLLLILLRIF